VGVGVGVIVAVAVGVGVGEGHEYITRGRKAFRKSGRGVSASNEKIPEPPSPLACELVTPPEGYPDNAMVITRRERKAKTIIKYRLLFIASSSN